LQDRGAEALLDMRVRWGGSHHQKMVVIRHRDDPARDIAFVGGIDLSHARRDDHLHHGDPQPQPLSKEYGDRPPWHDCQAAITGPAVYDVETSFRERWEDPTPLTRHPFRRLADAVRRLDVRADPLPAQQPPPPPAGPHAVQVLRTYPDLRQHRDYAFAVGGERSIARGYRKALARTERIVYLEDQYLWGHDVGESLTDTLEQHPDLHIVAVVPVVPDIDGAIGRTPQLLGRLHAISAVDEVAPGRVHVFSIENHAGTPVYVHAKICVLDDTWAVIGSDNFNRRSWTHDSEISVGVVDQSDEATYARDLRLTMAAEHLDRDIDDLSSVEDCIEPLGMVRAFQESAERLQTWYDGGQVGERPPGRLLPIKPPEVGWFAQRWAEIPLRLLHDPDGRPRALRKRDAF
ncbi:MAG: phospholipase D-like domain-containing protein, partial [Nocardioides sp.]